ncbi:hypothetical protein OCT63_17140 [Vibrio sp. RW]|uniref:hypothetical protein n=1 Tax=Vibrio sp. RW TaxID=2998833 RepID=UPI0022CD82B0|nr:hypothetical protein [Vibrio sp. RW]MDA0145953.1 hypothetical protein [Vibrio sp. RW]
MGILQKIGTALELCGITKHATDQRMLDRWLVNIGGYNMDATAISAMLMQFNDSLDRYQTIKKGNVERLLKWLFMTSLSPQNRAFNPLCFGIFDPDSESTDVIDWLLELKAEGSTDYDVLVDAYDALYRTFDANVRYVARDNDELNGIEIVQNPNFSERYRSVNGHSLVEIMVYSLFVCHESLGSSALNEEAMKMFVAIHSALRNGQTLTELAGKLPSDTTLLKIIKLGASGLNNMKTSHPTTFAMQKNGVTGDFFMKAQTYERAFDEERFAPDNDGQTSFAVRMKQVLTDKLTYKALDSDGKEAKFFLYNGNLAIITRGKNGEYFSTSARKIVSIRILESETDEQRQMVAWKNDIKTTAKFNRLAMKSTFSNHFIDTCRYSDPLVCPYKNNITSGTRIDGQVISVETVAKAAGYEGKAIQDSVAKMEKYSSSRFSFQGYDGSASVETTSLGDMCGYFSKEYKGCANGYYYILINQNSFIGIDID